MARQRMVKPDFFDSSSLADCSHGARLAFIGLWVMGDDNGNVKLDTRRLRLQIFRYDEYVTNETFTEYLRELESVGCIKVYEVDEMEYITTVNFATYQTVKNPSKTNIPKPPASVLKKKTTAYFSDYGRTNPALTQEGDSHGIEGGKGGVLTQSYGRTNPALTPIKELNNQLTSPNGDLKREGQKRKTFKPPSVEEVENYCKEKNYTFNAETFIAFYDSNGWKVGKNPMKDWKAACTTWHKRRESDVSAEEARANEISEKYAAYNF